MNTDLEPESLESRVAKLEKIIADLLSKDKYTSGYADIYQYKNSLLLVSKSKEIGTYSIKDLLKQQGAKWTTITDKDGNKISGWIILGVCKDVTIEVAIKDLVDKLKQNNCTLDYSVKSEITT